MNRNHCYVLLLGMMCSFFMACFNPTIEEKTAEPTTTQQGETTPPTSTTPSTTTTIDESMLKNIVDYALQTIEEETAAYKINAQYPVFEGDKLTPALQKQNQELVALVRQKVADFKKNATEEKVEKAWVMELVPTLVYANDRLVSVAFSSMEEFGGAHPSLLEFTYNYDVQNEVFITAANTFIGNYKAKLFPLMRKNVMEVYYGGEEGCDIAEYEVVPNTFSFDIDKLIFYFPELPHVCGHPIAEVKYAEIPSDIILPKSALASRY